MTAGPLLIRALGYEKEPGSANVFMRDGESVTLKCANLDTNRIGVYVSVLERVAFVIAAFRRNESEFDLYELKRADFERVADYREKPGPQRQATKDDIVVRARREKLGADSNPPAGWDVRIAAHVRREFGGIVVEFRL